MLARLLYAVNTLVALWAFSGGESSSFWPKLWVLAVSLAVSAGFASKLVKPVFSRATWFVGAGSALATALPFVVLIVLAHKSPASVPDWIAGGVAAFKGPSLWAFLLATALIAPSWEWISRGVIGPDWGMGGIAFLDALTVGFGSQRFLPFAIVWAMGVFWGWLAQKTSLAIAIVSHTVWAAIVMLTLLLIGIS